ncbi:SH3 domain-containing protein [Streptomyces sp. NPDC016309]|uniref:SH3 domain-containing protein n=1 Tax=Streptomyces sp. NPDC016309 TaxID=3364965 RepID=UPI0036F84C84
MSAKIKAAVLLGSIALTGAAMAPAHAVGTTPSVSVASFDGKTAAATTTSKGGHIRTSPYGTSSSVSWAYAGEVLTVYGYDYNSYGNKWYDVVDSAGYSGWIYCGNVTAGC